MWQRTNTQRHGLWRSLAAHSIHSSGRRFESCQPDEQLLVCGVARNEHSSRHPNSFAVPRQTFVGESDEKKVVRMASNQVEEFRRARDVYDNARKSGVKGRDLAELKAKKDAAESRCPRGSTSAGIFG